MAEKTDLFFTELREQRREMNDGFNRIYDALEDHKKQTMQLYEKTDTQVADLKKSQAIFIGATKTIGIIGTIILFVKQIIS